MPKVKISFVRQISDDMRSESAESSTIEAGITPTPFRFQRLSTYNKPSNYEPRSYALHIVPRHISHQRYKEIGPHLRAGEVYYRPTLEKQLRGLELDRNVSKYKRNAPYDFDMESTDKPRLKFFGSHQNLEHNRILSPNGNLNKSIARQALKAIKRRFPDIKDLELSILHYTNRTIPNNTAAGNDKIVKDFKYYNRKIKLGRKK